MKIIYFEDAAGNAGVATGGGTIGNGKLKSVANS